MSHQCWHGGENQLAELRQSVASRSCHKLGEHVDHESQNLFGARGAALAYARQRGGQVKKEVTTLLNLSVDTVETYRTHIMQMLDLHNTAEIVLYAVRNEISS